MGYQPRHRLPASGGLGCRREGQPGGPRAEARPWLHPGPTTESGCHRHRQGRTDEARLIYEQTIASNAVNPGVLWQAHAGLARLALASGDWERASQSFEAGIRIVEQSRSELNG